METMKDTAPKKLKNVKTEIKKMKEDSAYKHIREQN